MLEHLASLGFANAEQVNARGDQVALRIRTSNGWVYEWFKDGDTAALDAWAARHRPEAA